MSQTVNFCSNAPTGPNFIPSHVQFNWPVAHFGGMGKKNQKVLVHEKSRFGRNAYDVLRTVKALFEAKCFVFDFRQHQETMDRYYQKTTYATMVLPVLASMAEE